jgi:hypothetical protein
MNPIGADVLPVLIRNVNEVMSLRFHAAVLERNIHAQSERIQVVIKDWPAKRLTGDGSSRSLRVTHLHMRFDRRTRRESWNEKCIDLIGCICPSEFDSILGADDPDARSQIPQGKESAARTGI